MVPSTKLVATVRVRDEQAKKQQAYPDEYQIIHFPNPLANGLPSLDGLNPRNNSIELSVCGPLLSLGTQA